MRALNRMRLLAAVCALLLLTFGPLARAGVPGRPIDQPQGPPTPNPTEVGDPDQPPGSIAIPVNGWLTFKVPVSWVVRLSRGFELRSGSGPGKGLIGTRKVTRGR